jgi:hypothetical protein
MGTIVIEEYSRPGTDAKPDTQVINLEQLVARTEDATTSSTAESITLNASTNLIRVYTEEIHRLCVKSDTTGTIYLTTEAAKWIVLGAPAGETLYYELDA